MNHCHPEGVKGAYCQQTGDTQSEPLQQISKAFPQQGTELHIHDNRFSGHIDLLTWSGVFFMFFIKEIKIKMATIPFKIILLLWIQIYK